MNIEDMRCQEWCDAITQGHELPWEDWDQLSFEHQEMCVKTWLEHVHKNGDARELKNFIKYAPEEMVLERVRVGEILGETLDVELATLYLNNVAEHVPLGGQISACVAMLEPVALADMANKRGTPNLEDFCEQLCHMFGHMPSDIKLHNHIGWMLVADAMCFNADRVAMIALEHLVADRSRWLDLTRHHDGNTMPLGWATGLSEEEEARTWVAGVLRGGSNALMADRLIAKDSRWMEAFDRMMGGRFDGRAIEEYPSLIAWRSKQELEQELKHSPSHHSVRPKIM